MEVNLYIEQTIKGAVRKDGQYGYIFEFPVKGEIKTKIAYGSAMDATAHQIELIALIDALKRLTKPCTVTICSSHGFYKNVLVRDLISKWQQDSWKNSKGHPVGNKKEWEELLPELVRHTVITGPIGEHQYLKYMLSEMKNLEDKKCKIEK